MLISYTNMNITEFKALYLYSIFVYYKPFNYITVKE